MKNKIIPMFFFILIFMVPVLILTIQAFSARWIWPQLLPETINLQSIKFLSEEKISIGKTLLSSFSYSIAAVLLSFTISLFPAAVFARYNFKFKPLLESLLLLPVLVPSITFAMGIHFLFIYINLADTFMGVVLVLTVFSYPYMFRSLISGYRIMGTKYMETAKNLGGGIFSVLLKIELPLILPAAAAGGTIVFLAAFSEYFLVFLIGGGSVLSYSGYLFPYLLSTEKQTASLLGLIFLLIPIMLFIILDITVIRYYRKRGIQG